MDKNKVKISQLALLLMLVLTGGKFLSLPSVLAEDVGHDSWLVVCFNFLLDAVCLCFLLWAIKINKNALGLDVILDNTVTPAAGKIILAVFFVMFMTRVIVLLENCYETFAIIFDITTNWVLFILPIVFVAAFAILRGFNSIARLGEILFSLVFLSIIAITIYPITKTQFSQLLPVAEAGIAKIMKTSLLRCQWFADYVFIYFVMENIKPQKRIFSPILVSFGVGVVLTVLLNMVFVALFGSLAQHNDIAMIKIGLFSVADSTNGRWDWLTLTVWITSVVVKIVIFTFCAYKCVEKIFRLHFTKVNFAVLGGIFIILLLPMFVSMDVFRETFMYWCVLPFAAIEYILPLFMPLLTSVANKKVTVKPVTEAASG